ncbi:unnamed protein product, partial [Linum tenue]
SLHIEPCATTDDYASQLLQARWLICAMNLSEDVHSSLDFRPGGPQSSQRFGAPVAVNSSKFRSFDREDRLLY